MRRRLLPVLAVAVAVAPLGATPAAPARPVLALQDDKVFVRGLSPFSADQAFGLLESLDVRTLRVSVAWNEARRRDGSYDFAPWQATIAQARARGIGVRITLAGPAPAAFTSDRRVGYRRPDAAAFGRFAAAAAEAMGQATGFAIWNEPNWHRLLSPARESPRRYRALYAAAYRAIKRADPGMPVILGELAPGTRPDLTIQPRRFLREMSCLDARYRPLRGTRCAPLRADGVAFHPYHFNGTPTRPYPDRDAVEIASLPRAVTALRRLRQAGGLRFTRGATMPIYLTEMGYFTAGERRTTSPATTARHLAAAWRQATRIPSVREFLQYLLVNPPDASEDMFRTGLMSPGGVPFPSFDALRAAVRDGGPGDDAR